VHDDGAVEGAIVEAGVEAAKTQRIAVTANVGVVGAKQPEARLVALVGVGKCRGQILAAAAACGRNSAGGV